MSDFGQWIRRKRFATAGHIGMLEAQLEEISAGLKSVEQVVADTRHHVGDLERTAADTREAAAYTRRALELGVSGQGLSSPAAEHARKTPEAWFNAHYWEAADQILSFLAASGIGIGGREVADIGSGDGIIDLALATRGAPERLVGYDVSPTDAKELQRIAAAAAVDELPANLSFAESGIDAIPAPDESFDLVVSWSTFEHVSEPLAMLKEIRRILRPSGTLMIQLWPFYYSDHGGHLWLTHGGGFPHLLMPDDELITGLKGKVGTDERRPADDEYLSLNRLTLDQLNDLLLSAGLKVARAELISEVVNIPPQVDGLPLSDLLISGIKLLAVPLTGTAVEN